MFELFGDTDFTARLAPVLMGTLMVPLPYLLRGQLGRVGAFAAAVLLAFGPSYLYFSRFAREDIYFAAITLALVVVAFRFLDRPQRHQPALIGALLAASFAIKETDVHHRASWPSRSSCVVLISPWRRQLIDPIRAVGLEAWGWALAAFLGVYTLLFTTFLTNPDGVRGLYTGLDYWLGQHEVGRGGEAWNFYLVVLFGVEWPVLLLGAVGAVASLRRPTLLRAVPDLGLRGLADRLLVGGREVRLAGAAPAAAAAAAGRHRRAGDLETPAGAGTARSARSSWCRLRLRRLRLVPRQRRAPRRPARAAGLDAVVGGRQARRRRGRRARRAASRRRSPSTPPRARRSRGRGTSATCRSATWSSAPAARRRPRTRTC